MSFTTEHCRHLWKVKEVSEDVRARGDDVAICTKCGRVRVCRKEKKSPPMPICGGTCYAVRREEIHYKDWTSYLVELI